jgi:hypothetical protein
MRTIAILMVFLLSACATRLPSSMQFQIDSIGESQIYCHAVHNKSLKSVFTKVDQDSVWVGKIVTATRIKIKH